MLTFASAAIRLCPASVAGSMDCARDKNASALSGTALPILANVSLTIFCAASSFCASLAKVSKIEPCCVRAELVRLARKSERFDTVSNSSDKSSSALNSLRPDSLLKS